MKELHDILIQSAQEKYQRIHPCSDKDTFGECFTTEDNILMFWFNTEDNSTHVIATTIPRLLD